MKQTKRLFGVLLSLCLMLGILPGVASAASGTQFTDVNAWDWYYDAVQYVSREGLMSGTSATTFEPNTTTTRGMIVTILYRMEGSPAYMSTSYTDVPANEWYTPAVSWANTYNIVKGYGDGKFGPNDPITREQLATILFRYAQMKKYNTSMTGDLTKFSDKAQISSYDAQIALSWAVGKGVMTGTSSTLLEPKTEATRALAAYTLKSFADNVVGTGKSSLVPSDWGSVPSGWTSVPQAAPEEEAAEYTVSFYLNYGKNELYKAETVTEGNTVAKPSTPRRSNYRFLGWYESSKGLGRSFDFSSEITSDVTLYAQWERDTYYREMNVLRYRLKSNTVPNPNLWQYWNWNNGFWNIPTKADDKAWTDYEWEFWNGSTWLEWDKYTWEYYNTSTGKWAAATPTANQPWTLWTTYYWDGSYVNGKKLRYYKTADYPTTPPTTDSDYSYWNLYWDNYYWWEYGDDYDDWYWWYYQNGYDWPPYWYY